MSDPSTSRGFTFVDVEGNTLSFDGFGYEYQDAKDKDSANWLNLRITFNALIRHAVDATILTSDLRQLGSSIRDVVDNPEKESEWEPLEPWAILKFRRHSGLILVEVRFALTLGLGPFVEYVFECSIDEVRVTYSDVVAVISQFPER